MCESDHAPEYIIDNVTENASSKSIYRYIVNYIQDKYKIKPGTGHRMTTIS
jgi:hypothetical protein